MYNIVRKVNVLLGDTVMAKTIEELNKIINEQEVALLIKEKQRLLLDAAERAAIEKIKLRLADDEGIDDIPELDVLQQLHKNPKSSFQLQSASGVVKNEIFENFAKEYGKENIHDNCLNFPSLKDADDFFSRQAQAGHAFLFQELGCDNYAFSDGKGHYKMGNQAEIVSYCKQNSLKAPFVPEAAEEKPHTPVHR